MLLQSLAERKFNEGYARGFKKSYIRGFKRGFIKGKIKVLHFEFGLSVEEIAKRMKIDANHVREICDEIQSKNNDEPPKET